MAVQKPTLLALLLAIVYFVWPIDCVPDVFGPIGRIDDLLVFLLIAWQAYRYKKKPSASRDSGSVSAAPDARTALEVFGLGANATLEDVEKRYRELAQQYHPDKVSHLGPALREVAHEKMLEIRRAYDQLRASFTAAP